MDQLRAAGDHVPELCVVAVEDGEVIGHVCFSRAEVGSGEEVLALAPMGVVPTAQRRGVGSALVEAGLTRAARTDFPLVVVLGHPEYYPRFGFKPALEHGVMPPFDVPPDSWMIHRLPSYRPGARGVVTYAEAFARVA